MQNQFPTHRFQDIETPFYYYDAELLRQTLRTITAEASRHRGFKVHYAVKANANHKLLSIINAAGLGADCVSGGEIKAVLDAGFPAHKIVYAGVGKKDWEIRLGIEKGIECFNVESLAELEVIDSIAQDMGSRARVALRINPEVGAHTHANITTGLAENKFGIAMRDIDNVIERTLEMKGIEFVGLHFHIGSQILDMGDFEALCNRINELLPKLQKKHNVKIKSINVGGGLGVDYTHPNRNAMPDFRSYFDTYARCLKLDDQQTLHFELGRAVVCQCGSLISRVLYVKEGVFKKFCIIDAGMTDLIRPALYQASHKIENISSDCAAQTYDVVGPICESSDVFAKAIDLNACHRGDLLAIRSAGAYGEVMASQYNCRPLAKAYLSDEF